MSQSNQNKDAKPTKEMARKKSSRKKRIDSDLKAKNDWIELVPWGVTASANKSRPVMLFREKEGEAVLPVWIAPLDAGIAITQHHVKASAMSPHDLTLNVMSSLGVKLEKCFFKEIKGFQQHVELEFSGSRRLKRLAARADHALSFCLQARAQFFCTRGYLQECRDVQADLEKAEIGLMAMPDVSVNRHPYLM